MTEGKNNSAQFHGIDFQPMPKRFMVWDEKTRHFIKHSTHEIWRISDIAHFYKAKDTLRYKIVQSTNLFDKNGKEIFEGSILKDFDENILVVECSGSCSYGRQLNGKRFPLYGHWFASYCHKWNYEEPKLIGHILPNPELLEEKND